jgi:CBS domain-containing protein
MSESSTPLSSLANIRVSDVMNRGVLTCSADDSLRHVAAIMAKHRVHSVVITGGDARRPEGVVDDVDVIAAVAAGVERTAGEVGRTEPLSVSARARVQTAAQIMTEHGVSHLVVVDSAGGYPIGVLSSLDIAVVYGGR